MKIPKEVVEILLKSEITETSVTLPFQLERSIYMSVDKVLKAAGGKWDRKSKSHIFPKNPREILGLAMETGKIVDKKTELQAFYTPKELARKVVGIFEGKFDDSIEILEPSAGEGALVESLLELRVKPKMITTCEIDPEVGANYRNVVKKHYVGDFTQLAQEMGKFSLVVMNPPFTKGQATEHVLTALRMTTDTLVAIMPPTWLTSNYNRDKELRMELDENFEWSVMENAPGSFKSEGTNVKTVTLVASRV